MLQYTLAFLLLLSSAAFAQNTDKDFEGIITYKTTFILKDKNLDTSDLYKQFGRERDYYFKGGRYKWAPKNHDLEFEVFNPLVAASRLIDKYSAKDTLFITDVSKVADTVLRVKQLKEKVIFNVRCKAASFVVAHIGSKTEPLTRTIYYPASSFTYDVKAFEQYKAMGQNFISKYCGSVPLRLELDRESMPFTIVYEAINIQWKPIDDSEFKTNDQAPVLMRN